MQLDDGGSARFVHQRDVGILDDHVRRDALLVFQRLLEELVVVGCEGDWRRDPGEDAMEVTRLLDLAEARPNVGDHLGSAVDDGIPLRHVDRVGGLAELEPLAERLNQTVPVRQAGVEGDAGPEEENEGPMAGLVREKAALGLKGRIASGLWHRPSIPAAWSWSRSIASRQRGACQ